MNFTADGRDNDVLRTVFRTCLAPPQYVFPAAVSPPLVLLARLLLLLSIIASRGAPGTARETKQLCGQGRSQEEKEYCSA